MVLKNHRTDMLLKCCHQAQLSENKSQETPIKTSTISLLQHTKLNVQSISFALYFIAMAPTPNAPIKVGHIPDVQELVNELNVPERFIRDMVERPAKATTETTASNIPVIDLSKLVEGDKTQFDTEISKLSASCEEWGFFQVYILFKLYRTSCSV